LPYTFSLIVFSLQKLLNSHARLNGHFSDDVKSIVALICAEIRETDLVSLRGEKIISILLPDTDHQGAQCACQRLVGKLSHLEIAHLGRTLHLDDFDVEIISDPEKSPVERLPEKAQATEFPSERRNRTQPSSAPDSRNVVRFKGFALRPMNVCVSYASSVPVAVSLAEVFFWDLDYSLLIKRTLKRAMDIVGAIIGLVCFLPVMTVVGVLIKLTSPGPILFKQCRLGYEGQRFTFLKFRSMQHNCNDTLHQAYVKKLIEGKNTEINNGTANDPFYKITNDPRITPMGRFIRKTSIDELPQFWNVLRGEMSLMGPRPAIPYELEKYQNWHFRRILEVKPGITGLWQVSGRSRTTFNEMVRLDIHYATHRSLGMDIKIICKTVGAVFHAEGA
jgi:lipopolysaccharide/colanic/teichoic acid biosynthesis glycosyltransferase